MGLFRDKISNQKRSWGAVVMLLATGPLDNEQGTLGSTKHYPDQDVEKFVKRFDLTEPLIHIFGSATEKMGQIFAAANAIRSRVTTCYHNGRR